MAKPIKMTDDIYEEIVAEFREKMKKFKMFDGEIEYKTAYEYKDSSSKALVKFTPTAWIKMMALVQSFKTEVAWHGFVERDPEDESVFIITDVLIYPQLVTNATVDSDEEKYPEWLAGLGMDLNRLRMQGHSHVEMGVSPSGTDLDHQKDLLSQIGQEDFYIFMIWNKKYDRTIKIFDLKNNILYENKDVEVDILDFDDDIDIFLKEADKMVAKKTYTYGSSWNKSSSKKSGKDSKTKSDSKGGEIIVLGKDKKDDLDYDDDDFDFDEEYEKIYKEKYQDMYGDWYGLY